MNDGLVHRLEMLRDDLRGDPMIAACMANPSLIDALDEAIETIIPDDALADMAEFTSQAIHYVQPINGRSYVSELTREDLQQLVHLNAEYAKWIVSEILEVEQVQGTEEESATLMVGVPAREVLPLVSTTLQSLGLMTTAVDEEDLEALGQDILKVAGFGQELFEEITNRILSVQPTEGARLAKAMDYQERAKELGVHMTFGFDDEVDAEPASE